MVTYTIIFLLFLAATVMPTTLTSRFTSEELSEMGIRLENSSMGESR